MKIRLEITKDEAVRYIGHLDYVRAIERTIRRAGLPAAYSEGFNPHMKLAFASALAVGVTSSAEYADIELTCDMDCQIVRELLNKHFPAGISCKAAIVMPERFTALMALVNMAAYTVAVDIMPGTADSSLQAAVSRFEAADEIAYVKFSPKKRQGRAVNVKDFVHHIVWTAVDGKMVMSFTVDITSKGSIKPVEVLESLEKECCLCIIRPTALIKRTGLYAVRSGQRFTPLEVWDGEE